jgi:hypothetical protein
VIAIIFILNLFLTSLHQLLCFPTWLCFSILYWYSNSATAFLIQSSKLVLLVSPIGILQLGCSLSQLGIEFSLQPTVAFLSPIWFHSLSHSVIILLIQIDFIIFFIILLIIINLFLFYSLFICFYFLLFYFLIFPIFIFLIYIYLF